MTEARKVERQPSVIDWTLYGYWATNDAGEEKYFKLVLPIRFRVGDIIELTSGEPMAEPKLQIEKRVEKIEVEVKRISRAVGAMAQWLVQAQTGFNAKDAEGIEKILRGEESEEVKENADESSLHT